MTAENEDADPVGDGDCAADYAAGPVPDAPPRNPEPDVPVVPGEKPDDGPRDPHAPPIAAPGGSSFAR
jgi:hypothetical protein